MGRKKVLVNLHTRFLLLVGLFLLVMSVVNLWSENYADVLSMLFRVIVVLFVAMLFPTGIVFDWDGLQVRYLFGFYEGFSWKQLEWLEPCADNQGAYWLPHLKGEPVGEKPFSPSVIFL